MIIRETRITECWCSNCGAGQMQHIFQRQFEEKKSLSDYIGQVFKCAKCEADNILEDVIQIVPVEYLVSAGSEASKAKSNSELKNWLNQE